jgi:ABC-2 type transport system permease protein
MGNSVRNTMAIASKELRGYFASPIAWVMMALFALIFGRFFTVYLDYFLQQAMQAQFGGAPPQQNVNMQMIRPLLSNASVLALFLLPMITMRTYAEEKRSGTIELLLTSPLKDIEIVLGKFIGAVGLYAALLVVTLFHIGILFWYGSPGAGPEVKPIVTGYIGLLLLGACFISVGLFISSTTKNQMVAAAATFVLALLFWIMDWSSDSAGPTLGPLLQYLSITQHFDDFGKGVIDTKHLIFYFSFITFGLYLTLKSVDSERWRG